MKRYADIAFTAPVQAIQQEHGSRDAYARHALAAPRELGEEEIAFLTAADSFFLATISATGWPYVQHRGGPPGFMRVVSRSALAFADFAGNRQYISVGNAAGDDRASMIVLDYAMRRRLKLFGRLRFTDRDPITGTPAREMRLPGYRARVERVGVLEVEAFDWNCPQHIPARPRQVE